ncbi:hydrogen peroxide-inducible genes activator [Shimia abyssi]|uniref:LysR family transcriptional regulator n=1 Tax=Shimia abyssi TaxID=1662395 RepID=A0A2P8FHP1_9RHOB|nr:hydrogen peroxide-inducible genes activator [Shimia abyssi]PSL21241.1 LysR family transcriptional regulator [Shimia abyssi]
MKPTLRQLEYLVSVAETGQFGLAAARLNVSQPSLSAQVAEAEEALGVRVFNRGRRGAIVTSGGADIVRRARRILHDMEDLRASVRGNGIFEGRLRFGILPSVGPYLLPRIVAGLHRQYPEFRLVVREEATQDLEEGLSTGRLDMILSTPEDHPGTRKMHLFDETLWIAVARDDELAGEGPVEPGVLAGRTILTLGRRHRLSLIVAALAEAAGAHVSDEYEGTSLDAVRLMAAAGSGVAVLPQVYAAAEAIRRDDISLRPIASPMAMRSLALIQPQGPERRPGSGRLAEALSAEAERIMAPLSGAAAQGAVRF